MGRAATRRPGIDNRYAPQPQPSKELRISFRCRSSQRTNMMRHWVPASIEITGEVSPGASVPEPGSNTAPGGSLMPFQSG